MQITVTKTDSETKEALEGAVFGLFVKEDIVNKDGKVIVKHSVPSGVTKQKYIFSDLLYLPAGIIFRRLPSLNYGCQSLPAGRFAGT